MINIIVMKKIRKFTTAFSTTELIISAAIIGILATIVTANFSRGRMSDDLRMSAQELASHIRRAQNLSSSGQTLPSGQVPPGGYGLTVQWDPVTSPPFQTSYRTFGDTHNFSGGCVVASPSDALSTFDEGCDQVIANLQTRPNVLVQSITVNGVAVPQGAGAHVDIAFKSPKPLPIVGGLAGTTVGIQLQHVKTGQIRTVAVLSASGQVSEGFGTLSDLFSQ